jgi:hypothetical protein
MKKTPTGIELAPDFWAVNPPTVPPRYDFFVIYESFLFTLANILDRGRFRRVFASSKHRDCLWSLAACFSMSTGISFSMQKAVELLGSSLN